jgi:hypothetical protein
MARQTKSDTHLTSERGWLETACQAAVALRRNYGSTLGGWHHHVPRTSPESLRALALEVAIPGRTVEARGAWHASPALHGLAGIVEVTVLARHTQSAAAQVLAALGRKRGAHHALCITGACACILHSPHAMLGAGRERACQLPRLHNTRGPALLAWLALCCSK